MGIFSKKKTSSSTDVLSASVSIPQVVLDNLLDERNAVRGLFCAHERRCGCTVSMNALKGSVPESLIKTPTQPIYWCVKCRSYNAYSDGRCSLE